MEPKQFISANIVGWSKKINHNVVNKWKIANIAGLIKKNKLKTNYVNKQLLNFNHLLNTKEIKKIMINLSMK
jgi:hypothetical protein